VPQFIESVAIVSATSSSTALIVSRMHHKDQPQSAMSNRSRATSSASASWTAKRTWRRCSLVSVAYAAATLSAFGSNAYTRCAGGGERGQLGRAQRWRCLDSVLVALLHSLSLRLVGLDGGAAGAELLRLAARVFELGAGVGVDELAGLDPLEAVTL
jgi:hypothetical protein